MKPDVNLGKLCEECERLWAENGRLYALLEQHGISWEFVTQVTTNPKTASRQLSKHKQSNLNPVEKIALFRSLFRGRSDVYPIRWESTKGKSGYSPTCRNEWRPDLCGKPAVKCADCIHRQFLPITDEVIFNHLAGKQTIGIYPLLPDDTCYFLATDFGEANWRSDAQYYIKSCFELNIPASLEISRSGQGAHAWIFFGKAVPAQDVRRLGAALISYTCACTRQLSLSSYDSFFPNHDTLPKGGFGNLIALPL